MIFLDHSCYYVLHLMTSIIQPEAFGGKHDKVGVFEGAGYASKGLYRSMVYCLMISSPKDEFCLVCRRAIARMIDYFTEAN